MEGISKEFLLDQIKDCPFEHRTKELERLVMLCKELNPWLPIDENAPKDEREILLFVPGCYGCEIGRWNINSDNWSCYPYEPTHYQELPDDPV